MAIAWRCLLDPIRLAILVQCRLVKDRQADGQTNGRTDRQTLDDSIYRASVASRGKNYTKVQHFYWKVLFFL